MTKKLDNPPRVAATPTTEAPLPKLANPPRGYWNPFIAIFRHMVPSSRKEVLTTDRDLQLGPPPVGIERQVRANNVGISGARMVRGWPETSDSLVRLPHLTNPREVGRIAVVGKQSDDALTIPAVYIGNPK